MIQVLVAGEGPHEIGREDQPGVIVALLRRIRPDGWEVAARVQWCRIPKFAVGRADHGDEASVRRLLFDATERQVDVVAFTRDQDSEPARRDAIDRAIAAHAAESEYPAVVGGVAVRTIDAWCVALQGTRGSEGVRYPKEQLQDAGHGGTSAYVAIVEGADLAAIPDDAVSLSRWLERASKALR